MNAILRKSLIAVGAFLLCLMPGCSSAGKVMVLFSDRDQEIAVSTGETLKDALEEQGYRFNELQERYQPSIPWDQKVQGQDYIQLTCKCKVSLQVAGQNLGTFQTLKPTVGAVLKEKNVTLTEWDKVNFPLDKKIQDGMSIVVDRFEQKIKKKVEEVPFKTKEEKDDKLAKGKKKVEQEGKSGKKVFEVLMLFKNGQILTQDGKKAVTEKLIATIHPVDKVVKVGTNKQLAEEEQKPAAKGTMVVEATGYTHTGALTASGTVPKRGTIAVDPSVIPLGTRLYVPGYGYGVAEDTGGAIKGHIIDLFFETREECIKWGRRTVTIQILK
jgi:3D (Asp-Asp-Asp) domain-containing protein